MLPHFGEIADDLTLIRSMTTGVNNHGELLYALNTGRTQAGRPSLGSWLTYGLGTSSQDLPAYVVLTDPGGLPVLGTNNWSNGWLPALYQGTITHHDNHATLLQLFGLDPKKTNDTTVAAYDFSTFDENLCHSSFGCGFAALESSFVFYARHARNT